MRWPDAHATKRRGRAMVSDLESPPPRLDWQLGQPSGHWTAPDGARLGVRAWNPAGAPRAVVVLVPGLNGAAEGFHPLGDHLAAHGILALGTELRGQGLDPEPARRGDLADLGDCVHDIAAFGALTAGAFPGQPWFLCGESMGAMLSLRAVADGKTRPAGLIMLAPVVALRERPPWWQEWLFRVALRFAPRRKLDLSAMAEKRRAQGADIRVASDAAMEDAIRAAPHFLREFSLRFLATLARHIEESTAAARRADLPALVLSAGRDAFMPAEGIERVLGPLRARGGTFRHWPDAFHLLLFDAAHDEVLAAITDWMGARIAAADPQTVGRG